MITLLSNLPDNIIGLNATGRETGEDYSQVLVPAVEAALERHDKIRPIYELDDEFTGFTPDAIWEDTKLGLGHLGAWEKIALVTDIGWIANAANVFKFLIPGEVRVFPLADRQLAQQWIAD